MPYDWNRITLTPETTIREALLNLDQNSMQIILITNHQKQLLGTVTDGDLRRALLRGATLDNIVAEAMNDKPNTGLQHESERVWRARMRQKSLQHLPIVNQEQQLVNLICDKTDKAPSWPNPVILMLGGLGMRLRPLTQTIPKPMLKVGNKPILETILEHVAEQGFSHFYFCINYLGEMIQDHFGDGSRWGVQIEYITEKQRMGTAGALSLLQRSSTEDLVVMNGDLLTKVDLGALLSFHQEHHHQATVCVREHQQQVPYGVMEMNGTRLTQLVEKPIYRYFVNAGIYVLSPQTLELIPNDRAYDMPHLLDELISRKEAVGGFPLTEYWLDIGQLPDFQQAQVDFDLHFTRITPSEKACA